MEYFSCGKCNKVLPDDMKGISIINHNKTVEKLPESITVCKECIQNILVDLLSGDFSILTAVKSIFRKGK